MITWDILIPTIPHRDETLRLLLAEVSRQWQPGLGVRVYRDNLERPKIASYAKWQDLLESSEAEYVSWAGDDDFIAPDFVACVFAALASKPDYVGFPVKFTIAGEPQQLVEHSLRHPHWVDTPQMLLRDIVHTNPIRRELANLAPWEAKLEGEDQAWADRMRATGQVKTEAWIDRPMYYYQPDRQGSFWQDRAPMPEHEIRPLPEYEWLTAI